MTGTPKPTCSLTLESLDEAIYQNRKYMAQWHIQQMGVEGARKFVDREISDMIKARDELFGEHPDFKKEKE